MAKAYRIEVIDHTTGKRYRSLEEASKDLCVVASTLSARKKKQGNRFDLYGHDIELVETKVPSRFKKVRCVETGEEYQTLTEAGKALGVTGCAIYCQMAGKSRSVKGFHFRKV